MDAYLTEDTVDAFAKNQANRSGFCRRLVRAIFRDPLELVGKNVNGVGGKGKIDPLRVAWIRKVVLEKFPTNSGESELNVWKNCIITIDGLKRSVERDLQLGKRYRFDENLLALSCERGTAVEKENQGEQEGEHLLAGEHLLVHPELNTL